MVICNSIECNAIEWYSVERPNIYPNLNATQLNEVQLSDQQHCRLNKINEIKDYFVAEIKERELMSKSFFCDYFGKSLIVLSAASGSIFIVLLATVIGTPAGIAATSLCLAFSLSTGIVKKLLKTTRDKKKNHNKIIMLARSKLNSIESKVSEVSINSEISDEDFMIITNEEKNYRELKESIKIMNSQRSDGGKINLIEEGKK